MTIPAPSDLTSFLASRDIPVLAWRNAFRLSELPSEVIQIGEAKLVADVGNAVLCV